MASAHGRRYRAIGGAVAFVLLVAGLIGGTVLLSTGVIGGYVAADIQQTGDCDGVPAPHGHLQLLADDAQVVDAVICTDGPRYLPGRGIWTMRTVNRLPSADLPDLVSRLHAPDRHWNGSCTLVLTSIPDFVLTLADGSRVRPGVPGDGCHPIQSTLDPFDAATPVSGDVTEQVATQTETSSGCAAQISSPVAWLGAAVSGSDRSIVPSDGSLSVCRFPATTDKAARLQFVGSHPAGEVLALLPPPAATGPAGCAMPVPGVLDSPDYLIVVRTPTAPYRDEVDGMWPQPLFMVELGGCRRVIDGSATQLGYYSAEQTAALAALATVPNR